MYGHKPTDNRNARGAALTIVVLVLAAAAASLAAPILAPDHVKLRTLDNGLRVVVKEEPGQPSVAVALYVKAGSLYEPEGQSGVAYLVQRIVLLSPDSDDMAVLPELRKLGAEVFATTTRDFMDVTATVAQDYAPHVLRRIRKNLDEADFSADRVEQERNAVLEFIDRVGNVASLTAVTAYLTRALWETALQVHPYRNPPRGTKESVEKLTPEQAREFFERFYVPNNMSLIVVGGATADEATAWAQEAFGDMPRRDVEWEPPQADPPQDTPRKRGERDKRTPATMVAMAYRAPGINNKRDVCTVDVIYTILGQGQFGWLYTDLQEKRKLAVSAEVDFLTQREEGLFIITLGVPPDRELAARNAVEEKLAELAAQPLAPELLAEAKRVLRTSYAFQNETCTDQTGSLGFYDAIDTYEFAVDYINQVNAVTVEDVQRVAQTYLVPERASRVIIKPAGPAGAGTEVRLR